MTLTASPSDLPLAPLAPTNERSSKLTRTLGFAAVVLALISGVATFVLLTGMTQIVPTQEVVVGAVLVNLFFVLILCGLIGIEVHRLLLARRRGKAAARLHVRIVGLFSVIAVLPAILTAAGASVSLSRGLDYWFSQRTQQIVRSSLTVANAYVREHGEVVLADSKAMATDLDRAAPLYQADRTAFMNLMTGQSVLRLLPQAGLVRGDGTIILRARNPITIEFVPPPQRALDQAKLGEPVPIDPSPDVARVGALVKLKNLPDTYLYVTRPIDPRVLVYAREAKAGVEEYAAMQSRSARVQIAFGLMYLCIALSLLVSAMWVGLAFANQFVDPIRRLIAAADDVARGNFNVRVRVKRSQGDLASLSQTFNAMALGLRDQRQELLNVNDMIDRRRRFTEAVLSGATAGVIGVDQHGLVTLANRSAERLLGGSQADFLGRPLLAVAPELSNLMESAFHQRRPLSQGQIILARGTEERVVSVRVTSEQSDAPEHGFVVTLDDITDLIAAQRTSAWADVARRIAHEIKNPLTPIQLSAERLRRKYGRVITTDREVFEQCTDTIIRQVGDIGRMVDEFSSFARMPKPVLEPEDVTEAVKQAVFLQQVASGDIAISVSPPPSPVRARFDRRLISQALTNIVKNAAEAIAAVPAERRGTPKISVSVRSENGFALIDVSDTGVGLPADNRNKLLEPYITTREAGTGLGLAIVRKIMEDHGGRIELLDGPELEDGRRGALVRLAFPLRAESNVNTPPRST